MIPRDASGQRLNMTMTLRNVVRSVSGSRAARSFVAACFVVAVAGVLGAAPAAAQEAPRYELDPLWPKLPFGDQWLTGGLGGMCVGGGGRIFILNRLNVVPEDLDGARPAPPVIELDAEGNVVRGWGESGGDRRPAARLPRRRRRQASGSLPPAPVWCRSTRGDGSELLLQIGETGQYDSSGRHPPG